MVWRQIRNQDSIYAADFLLGPEANLPKATEVRNPNPALARNLGLIINPPFHVCALRYHITCLAMDERLKCLVGCVFDYCFTGD